MEDYGLFEFIGQLIIYGSGLVAIAYAFFIFLGKKWIENKFQESLQQHKHEHSKELEQLKYKINTYLDKASKIHEKEFEVLPEAWNKLHDALIGLASITTPSQLLPDFNRMSEEQLTDFLSNSKLYDKEKATLIKSPDKSQYYRKVIFWHESEEVKKSFHDFHMYIQKNSIFLKNDLKEQFSNIDKIIWNTLIDRDVSHETNDLKMWVETHKAITEKIEPIRNKIEELVQERLHYEI